MLKKKLTNFHQIQPQILTYKMKIVQILMLLYMDAEQTREI